MATSNSKQNESSIVKLAVFGIFFMGLYGLWQGNLFVQTKIAELPVQGKASTSVEEPKIERKTLESSSLNPLLIESKNKLANATAPASIQETAAAFTSLFEVKIDPKTKVVDPVTQKVTILEEAPLEFPDYFPQLGQFLKVDGVADGGAFIGGEFVEVGELLPKWAYPNKTGVMLTPRLFSVSDKKIVVEEPSTKRKLSIPVSD